MRRQSSKRRRLMDEANPWREAFKAEIGACEYCGKKASVAGLDCDEISRGSDRAKSLMDRALILVVHRHCHRIIQDWPRARRLALLKTSRPLDFNLERFWEVTGRNWPSLEEVLQWGHG